MLFRDSFGRSVEFHLFSSSFEGKLDSELCVM